MVRLHSLLYSAFFGSITADAVERDLVVAIYGGGVASATLAQALKGQSHLDVQYFDPAVDLTPTSFRLLGFDPKVHEALALVNEESAGVITRAGWYPEEPSVVVLAQGPEADSIVLDWSKLKNTTHRPQVTVVDPKPFLQQMLNGTDQHRLHANKTLVKITQNAQSAKYPLELKFQDGTIQYADILIGDDGPFGQIRGQVLGADHPATLPVFMNFLSAVAHVAPGDAEKLLGDKYGKRNLGRRFERVGQGSWFLNAYLDGFSTCLGSFYTEEKYDVTQFTRETSSEEVRARFGNLKRGDGIAHLLSSYSGLHLIPELEHVPAPSYIHPTAPIVMQGNAAHLMTNFQQLGPGQQIEDAMILGTLLHLAHDKKDVEAALYAYDAVRRPRSQWVSEHGKRLGWLWMGLDNEVGLDKDKLRTALLKWKEDGEAFDLEKHRDEAIMLMRKKLGTGDKVGEGDEQGMAQEERLRSGFQAPFHGEVEGSAKDAMAEQSEL